MVTGVVPDLFTRLLQRSGDKMFESHADVPLCRRR